MIRSMVFGTKVLVITFGDIIGLAILVVVFIVIPAWVFTGYRAGRRRQERIRSGFCANCAYDLRGSQNSDKCPECGDEITRYP